MGEYGLEEQTENILNKIVLKNIKSGAGEVAQR